MIDSSQSLEDKIGNAVELDEAEKAFQVGYEVGTEERQEGDMIGSVGRWN
jgi:NaMN:DMB phosphoribosyltransferase